MSNQTQCVVAYPAKTPSGATANFDMGHYLHVHMPMIDEVWGPHGMTSWEITRCPPQNPLDGSSSPYAVLATLQFSTLEGLKSALAAPDERFLQLGSNITPEGSAAILELNGQKTRTADSLQSSHENTAELSPVASAESEKVDDSILCRPIQSTTCASRDQSQWSFGDTKVFYNSYSTFPLDHLLSVSESLLRKPIFDFMKPQEERLQSTRKPRIKREPIQMATISTTESPRGGSDSVGELESEAYDSGLIMDPLVFLRFKRAFNLPPLESRIPLFRAYCICAHPSLPVIDLAEILKTFMGPVNEHPESFLLFQSIMLFASAFVDLPDPQRVDIYQSRINMRRDFYEKAKQLLYESDIEENSIIQIQSLLLMSDWYDNGDTPKDPYYWVGLAISAAYRLGIHQETADNLLYVSVRPLREKDLVPGRPLASTNDIIANLGIGIQFLDPEYTVERARQLLKTVKLCSRVAHILDSFYCPSWSRTLEIQTPVSLEPADTLSLEMGVTAEILLDSEITDISESEIANPPESFISLHQKRHIALALKIQHIEHYLHYLLGLCLVCYSMWLTPHTSCSVWRDRINSAAATITKIMQGLAHAGLITYAPAISVAAVLFAKKIHKMEIKVGRKRLQPQTLGNIRFCCDVLERLGETYPAALSQGTPYVPEHLSF
ncbi:hypothetical protein FE257_010438 [Aspergillus nanangensis]|uniref:Xylanolytic transcriptional activator regulatory domain-containing protein n=1 Tax=Aspergillus nanangensis TaxID=2582783 RepID=A0AAD4CIH8_ASPNN|nr:hypothetical protein FE257_010438 [Aspergillus nanangensis]